MHSLMTCFKNSNKHIISIDNIKKNRFHDTASPTDMAFMQFTVGDPTRLKMHQATIKGMCCVFK